jgi:hypothetical protein
MLQKTLEVQLQLSTAFPVARVEKIKDAPLGNPVFRKKMGAFFRPKIRQIHSEGGYEGV